MKTYNYLIVAFAALALVGCSDNDFLGTGSGPESARQGKGEISFAAGAKNITRAGEISGKDAAEKLGGQFMVYGYKSAADHDETEATFDASNLSQVFPFYRVNYVENSAYSTESNTHSWEYVGAGADYTTNPVSVNGEAAAMPVEQSIKYWDWAANHYDYLAWAINDPDEASLEALNTNKDLEASTKVYNLLFNTPSAASLGNVYVANRVTIENSYNAGTNPIGDEPTYTTGSTGRDDANKYGNYVLFSFRNMAAKVRIGIYETIPGYSVSDVKFYHSSTMGTDLANTGADYMKDAYEAGADEYTSTLFASSGTPFATGGKLAVAYKDYDTSDATNSNVAVAYTSASESDNFITFGELTRFQGPEKNEAAGNYIGRNSTQATMSSGKIEPENNYYTYVFPKDASEMNLQVDYTLTSVDGSGEIIKVKGAHAVVPAGFTNWLSNYAYTYLFKISDNTNGQSGIPGQDPAGLYPITFDALVVDMVDANTEETITEVARLSSITTYQKGSEVTAESEYKATTPISVVVEGGVALTSTNIALYAVKNLGTEPTTEEIIANYANNKIVLTDITSLLTIKDVYAGADGNDQTVGTNMVAEFVPVAGYNYAVKYTPATGIPTWKYIKIAATGDATQAYTISADPTVNVGGTETFAITANYNGDGTYPVLGAAKGLVATNNKLLFSEDAGVITVNAPSDALGADVANGSATVTLNSVAPANNTVTIQGWTLSDAEVACATTGNTVTLKLNNTDNTETVNVADFKTSNAGIEVTAASGATVTYNVAASVPAGTYTIKYENAVATITVKEYALSASPTIINGTGATSTITLANDVAAAIADVTLDNSNTSAGTVSAVSDGTATYTAGSASGISTLSYANASCTVEVTHFAVRVSKAIKHDKSDLDAGDADANIVANNGATGADIVYVEFTSDGAKTSASLAVTGTGAKIESAGSKGLYKLTMASSGTTTVQYTYKGQTFTLWSGTK